jgi:indole-3-glycerol phosphate synthase
MTILDEIVATKQKEVAALRARRTRSELEHAAALAPPTRGFVSALQRAQRAAGIAVIAEVKKASPSAGVIRPDFDAPQIARQYEAHGAACLSVLTDEPYFQGHVRFLEQIADVVKIPLLRKDFIIAYEQILEARAAGADAILLIAEILPGDTLMSRYQEARGLGLDVLIELHDAEQLPRVLATGTSLLGINNRDLRTFETRLEHTLDLLPQIPQGVTVVSESGICTHADLMLLQKAGIAAVLVGESLMRQADIGAALRALRGV